MENYEKIEGISELTELSQEAIEKMGNIQPIEVSEPLNIEGYPNLESIVGSEGKDISFKGGGCMCGCRTSCTRGF